MSTVSEKNKLITKKMGLYFCLYPLYNTKNVLTGLKDLTV